jgi:hypothetical protein
MPIEVVRGHQVLQRDSNQFIEAAGFRGPSIVDSGEKDEWSCS